MDRSTHSHPDTLVDLLRERAASLPDDLAFTHLDDGDNAGGTLTFAQLDGKARALAAHLQSLTQAQDRVLLVYPSGLDYVVAFFACAYAGLIAVPALPPTTSRTFPRLQGIARDARASIALAPAAIVGQMRQMQQDAELRDGDALLDGLTWLCATELGEASEPWRRPYLRSTDTLFLQYTSGSTGTPKGVMVSHRNLFANLGQMHAAHPVAPGEAMVSWLPPHHDMGLIGMILYAVYAAGHCVQFAPSAFLMRPYRWLKAISDYRAVFTAAPNFAYDQCIDRVTDEQMRALDLRSLTTFLNGAEPVRPETLRRFAERFAPCGLRPDAMTPGYGMAEATLMISSSGCSRLPGRPPLLPVSKDELAAGRIVRHDVDGECIETVSTGLAALNGHHVRIVDPVTCEALADDRVGEIWAHGPSIAKGYWNRPEETMRTFGATIAGESTCYLRTGDLGFIHDEELYISGRIKDLMIFNGRNVYPQDVERTIEAVDPAFRANGCAVFSVQDGARTRLVIVQELEARQKVVLAPVMPRLAAQIAEQHEIFDIAAMLLVKAGKVPRTSSGKLQRSLCRQLFEAGELAAIDAWHNPVASPGDGDAGSDDDSGSETERQLVGIWRELLGVERISPRDGFFSLGGHSLLAAQLISRVRTRFGVELSLATLFEAPTIAAMAETIARNGERAPVAAIAPVPRTAALPLSFAQQRLWFLDRLDPAASLAYHLPISVRLRGPLDRTALQAALDAVVARHESLRTHVVTVDGQPMQSIAADAILPLTEHDLRAMTPTQQHEAVTRIGREEAVAPFDLGTGPLIRARLLRLSDAEHVLLVTQHHIVTDGWSIGVLLRDLRALYGAFAQGRADPLAPLAIQYADYAAWQREGLRDDVQRTQTDFWRAQLQGAPALLELPCDRTRPAVRSHRGDRLALAVDARLTAGVRALARRHGVTPFMVLLGAWSALLSRLAGQSDLVIGTPAANRPRGEFEPLIGFFVNTLALRVRLDPDTTVAQLLAQIKATTLSAYAHQDLPFERLVEALNPVRDLRYSPIFQAMLTLDNTPGTGASAWHGLSATATEIDRGTTPFDLSLFLADGGESLDGYLEYATDLFDAATAARYAGHFNTLLAAMVDQDAESVDRLPLLTGDEQRKLLIDFNDTAVDYPEGALVHELFEAQAAATPDAVALVFDGESLTYDALNRRANRLAHRLIDLGIRPDDRVALCLERGMDMVAGLLGVLKAGGAYVPLDPAYPSDRLAYMLGDSAPVAVLTQQSLHARLRELDGAAATLVLDAPDTVSLLARQRDDDPDPRALGLHAGNLAYVIYTSGSTGRPKGVMNQHDGVLNFLHWNRGEYRLDASEHVLQKTPFSFDVSVWEFFVTLTSGARLVIARPDGHQDPRYLGDIVGDEKITLLHFVPSMLQIFLDHADLARCASLRRVLCIGEALPPSLQEQFHRLLPHVELHNLYGPTEAAVHVTFWRCDASLHDGKVPMGRPIANTRLYVLDAHGQPVPIGVAGEIHIGGANVARGYLHRPELTAERFAPDPFSTHADARLYRTGDLGRWLPNGTLEYLGRNDFQVKVRGFRIEPGEIESRLAALLGVREAVVVARDDAAGGKQLVAYVIPAQPAPSVADLRAALAETLPEYMVPGAFVALDAWPLTANGKLDRKALPAPDLDAVVTRAYAEPVGTTEREIARIWQALLGVPQIGRDDNFFELGGHSLLAIQASSRIQSRLGVALPLRALFEAPTVAQLARRVPAAGVVAGGTIVVADRSRPLPLSFAQQRLWFVQAMEGDSTTYNMPVSLRLAGRLDVDAFRAALQALVARHEVLRSRFVAEDGEVRVQVAPSLDVPIDVVDLAPSQVAAHERAHADHVFDLAAGPLLIAKLLRLDAGEHVLLVNVHHIVCDGWSMRILVGEWLALYDALRQSRPSPLPPPALQYADYAHWQRETLEAERLDAQLAYWTRQLAGAPELTNLPTDRPRPAVQRFDSGSETRTIDTALSQRVAKLGHEAGASVFMTLVSAFALLLSRYSGETDLLIGTPVVNRHREELENLIGLFLGNLVLRADLSGRPTFRELLARTRQTALDAYSNSDVPFERIVDALPLKRDLSRNPLFQVFFNMLDLPELAYRAEELDVALMDGAQFDAKFDLTVYAEQTAAGLKLHLVYNSALFDAARMQELLRQYEHLLEQIVAAPDRTIDDYGLLTAHAASVLPDPSIALDRDFVGSVPQLFAERCAATPDAPAVVSHERRWSYRELDAASERIACWLQDRDVTPGAVVAIHAQRNATLVAAILGVLKTGAAFMILDPAYPAGHLRACLEVAPAAAWLQIADASAADPRDVVAPGTACLDLRDIDGSAELQRFDGRRARPVAIGADDIALIAFTSGSTGKPKAVQSRHGPLTRFYPWLREHFDLRADDRFSLLSGLAHDPLQRDIFNALYLGASLHVPAPDTIVPGRLAQWMIESGVTVSHLTPAITQVLCDAPESMRLPALRHAFLIGDVLTRRDVVRLQSHAPDAQIVNTYGATETQRALSYYDLDRESAAQRLRQVVPLGRGMPGVQLVVLNAAGRRAGVGELGEIHIRSHHLARGYLDDPALTRERFLVNPFTGDAGDRMYRTGDLGRYLPDGNVECVGRADTQVKLRGFRIEPGHVEALLGEHPDVRAAVVMAREDDVRGRFLAAYVTVRERRPEPAALRGWLSARLPDYMQPSAYVFLDALPLTPNGKIDRRALPLPDGDWRGAAHVPASTPTEHAVAAIWADLLRRERVGVLDDFFALGGHSLLGTQVIARIRSRFEIDLPLRALFEIPTVAALSAAIDRELADLEEIEL
ncbi:non-ribosomal peptide synthetase [Tahibacter soli]|uniref:Amino acid adenylation domain-containing protein n=1 Tax=Tahibacter soli TaxID=2983605 RepID=A0A9X3YS83_9GAMM|nr:non-ribosomal peptide synthetase [Tahibacter soli]MDC8016188.1 amino acid adenylation domain-containing protein [Tahibacter soli]